MFLLKEQDELPALFTEMGELTRSGMVEEWRETARWVKFEEDVEEGGNRWSKPHVATLSLHALFQLRSCLMNGVIIMDSEAKDFSELIGIFFSNRYDFFSSDEFKKISRKVRFFFRRDFGTFSGSQAVRRGGS